MSRVCCSGFVGFALMLACAGAASAQASSADPLVGTWILNPSKSTLVGPPPRSRYRTIDATHDGMLHVSYGTIDDQGQSSFGFWEAKLDGTKSIEYMRSTGEMPFAVLYVKRISPQAIRVRAERNGTLSSDVTFTASADGRLLTEDMTSYNESGKIRNVRIYDKQP